MYRFKLCDWVDTEAVDNAINSTELEITRRWLEADSAAFDRSSAEAVVFAEKIARPGSYFQGWMTPSRRLSRNPSPEAIALLRRHPDLIDWTSFAQNPAPEAIAWMRAAPEKIGWDWMGINPNPDAVAMMLARLEELVRDGRMRDWGPGYMVQSLALCQHDDAVAFLERHPEHICWDALAGNPHPAAVDLLFRSMSEIDIVEWSEFFGLSMNTHPRALALLAAHPRAINWRRLSANPSPDALAILAANVRRIEWDRLCRNPNPDAIQILVANFDKIGDDEKEELWEDLVKTPAVFEKAYDYDAMRARTDAFKRELIGAAMHPRKLQRWIDAGGDIDEF